jgi:hypothetical protein
MSAPKQEPAFEVVTYDGLPLGSGGAHGLRTRDPLEALRRVEAFIDACVVTSARTRWTFRLMTMQESETTARLKAGIADVLGPKQDDIGAGLTWDVSDEQVETMKEFLVLHGPEAEDSTLPLIALSGFVEGGLIDPATGTTFPDITPEAFDEFAADGYGRTLGRSGLRGTFGPGSSSLGLWLNFPADDRLVLAVRHLQDHLPVRMSPKPWRTWCRTRNGRSYRSVRHPFPLAEVWLRTGSIASECGQGRAGSLRNGP